jgi:hypothetical protein
MVGPLRLNVADDSEAADEWMRSTLPSDYDIEPDQTKFPTNLLGAGYGTALLVALFLYSLHGGIVTSGLIFWLGGVVAVFFWGYIRIWLDRNFSSLFPASP